MATNKGKKSSEVAAALPPSLGDTPNLPDTPDLPDTADLGETPAAAMAAKPGVVGPRGTGDQVLALARAHIGETYILGARAPMGNAAWKGPWDCAEFVSWCVFQASGVLFGTEPRNDPMLADAFTGFWAQQASAAGALIPVEEAAGIAGAAVLRRPRPGAIGHIVLSDGRGGTVEAHSSARGVVADTLSGRRWDHGILVPGVSYLLSETPVLLKPASSTLRLTQPLTRGDTVRRVQRALAKRGFAPGSADGVYGPQTAHAVRLFQASAGLVADGEVGSRTLKALGLA